MIIKKTVLILLCALVLVSVGCGISTTGQMPPAADERPIIAVTIAPQRTFVEAVCGDLARVVTVVPPGSSPETYEPAPREIEDIRSASLYFSIGVPAEEAYIFSDIGDVKIVALHVEAALAFPDRTFEEGERDHHIWLSPKRVKVMIEAIAREMSKLDEANSGTYEKNAKEYIAQLEELDRQITAALEGVRNRKFIVYHPAFGYLADDYGLEMFALEEEGKEATPRHLQNMLDLAKQQNIKVIFYQEEIDSRQSQAYAEEIGGRSVQLEPLAPDYIENLKKMAETLAEAMR